RFVRRLCPDGRHLSSSPTRRSSDLSATTPAPHRRSRGRTTRSDQPPPAPPPADGHAPPAAAPTHSRRAGRAPPGCPALPHPPRRDRKSTRLTSSHVKTSYAVFCLQK